MLQQGTDSVTVCKETINLFCIPHQKLLHHLKDILHHLKDILHHLRDVLHHLRDVLCLLESATDAAVGACKATSAVLSVS